jgi:TrmH family RNA methyltransferase
MSIPVSNNEIKFVKSLEQKKFRDSNGMFVVEGTKMVEEAMRSSFEVFRRYRSSEIGVTAMSRMTHLTTPSPDLAVLRKPSDIEIKDLSYFSLPDKGLFLALDGIRDPGNLGTIIRIADWFGIDAVFASPDSVDIFNPKVVQATMGAIFRVKFHYCAIDKLCRFVSLSGGDVYGTFLDGNDIYNEDLNTGERTKSMIVIGNESNGISGVVAGTLNKRIFIPPYPENERGSESLNAAVATAVTVAEFRRRLLTRG